MSLGKRIINLLLGILMLACCALLMVLPVSGYFIVVGIMDILLIFSGVRLLIFYFTMARHMVDGLRVFFKGVFLVDLGIFLIGLSSVSKVFVVLYLIGIFAVTGAFRAFKGIEARKQGAKGWVSKLIVGICAVIIAILSLIFLNDQYVMVVLLTICMCYAGITRIISAFKKSEVVYIEV